MATAVSPYPQQTNKMSEKQMQAIVEQIVNRIEQYAVEAENKLLEAQVAIAQSVSPRVAGRNIMSAAEVIPVQLSIIDWWNYDAKDVVAEITTENLITKLEELYADAHQTMMRGRSGSSTNPVQHYQYECEWEALRQICIKITGWQKMAESYIRFLHK